MRNITYIAEEFGLTLAKESERLVVRRKGKKIKEIPFIFLRQIVIVGKGIAITSDLIDKCCEHGIPVDFLSFRGSPSAKLYSPNLSGSVEILKAQFQALDKPVGVQLAIELVSRKLEHQAGLLKHLNKYRKELYVEQVIDTILDNKASTQKLKKLRLDEASPKLLGIEGTSGSMYWKAFQFIIRDKAPEFPGRKGRGAVDVVNSMLNYGYGILYSKVWGMVALAGMEPFMGFIHKDRPGKPSLVLDIVEPFRVVVDHTVSSMVNDAKKLYTGEMTEDVRKKLADKVLNRLNKKGIYRRKKASTESIMQKTIRNISMFLRGKSKLNIYRYSFG